MIEHQPIGAVMQRDAPDLLDRVGGHVEYVQQSMFRIAQPKMGLVGG